MSASGYRTENRKRILQYLSMSSSRTVSVKDIYDYLMGHDCKINITTIYRFLGKLEEEGKVIPYHSEKGDKTTYQYVGEQEHCTDHLHLQCTECGKIIHLDCNFMDEITEHIRNNHDFMIQCRNSIIYGICKDCSSGKKR